MLFACYWTLVSALLSRLAWPDFLVLAICSPDGGALDDLRHFFYLESEAALDGREHALYRSEFDGIESVWGVEGLEFFGIVDFLVPPDICVALVTLEEDDVGFCRAALSWVKLVLIGVL